MTDYLYKKWEEESDKLVGDMLILEEDFRTKGCSSCGSPKEGNGQWIKRGGMVLVCPHMKKYVNKKLKKRIADNQNLLSYVSKVERGMPVSVEELRE